MKVLALDLGEAWVGVAISDSQMTHSFPLTTLTTKDLSQKLPKIVSDEQVELIVFGIPKTLKGETGAQAKKVLEQIRRLRLLQELQGLEWVEVDERFSSQGAMNVLHSQNKKIGKNKNKEHSIVAALLLESYLRSRQE